MTRTQSHTSLQSSLCNLIWEKNIVINNKLQQATHIYSGYMDTRGYLHLGIYIYMATFTWLRLHVYFSVSVLDGHRLVFTGHPLHIPA